ncbi:MAG: hypothetical protein AVDCRST_MAG86-1952 [uncultured Truepera sp.]|uniref:Uncharacterized protein n=1 Tax=uncultured Truepera sp. TaxID=543023 RepID=A0A6J4VA85_9DEIN|nr:MAG: hypothetical protein AVDCRST_MAG86-1952 [uncultured Truepera sp.]
MTQPQRYRWLTVGDHYTYVARPGKGTDARRGERCEVVTVPRSGRGPGNARVVFADGHVAIVPAGVLRKIHAP